MGLLINSVRWNDVRMGGCEDVRMEYTLALEGYGVLG